jgi:hypothetical protein
MEAAWGVQCDRMRAWRALRVLSSSHHCDRVSQRAFSSWVTDEKVWANCGSEGDANEVRVSTQESPQGECARSHPRVVPHLSLKLTQTQVYTQAPAGCIHCGMLISSVLAVLLPCGSLPLGWDNCQIHVQSSSREVVHVEVGALLFRTQRDLFQKVQLSWVHVLSPHSYWLLPLWSGLSHLFRLSPLPGQAPLQLLRFYLEFGSHASGSPPPPSPSPSKPHVHSCPTQPGSALT